jgi:hypothetical protein
MSYNPNGENRITRNETLFRGAMAEISAQADTEAMKSSKIAWRFCYSRKPFRDLVPECEPRDPGSIWRLAELDATGCPRDADKPRHTVTVLDSIFYTRTSANAQAANQES